MAVRATKALQRCSLSPARHLIARYETQGRDCHIASLATFHRLEEIRQDCRLIILLLLFYHYYYYFIIIIIIIIIIINIIIIIYIHIMISHHISSYLIISHDCLQSFMLISAVLPAQRFSPGLIELDHGFSASILRDRGGRDWWF